MSFSWFINLVLFILFCFLNQIAYFVLFKNILKSYWVSFSLKKKRNKFIHFNCGFVWVCVSFFFFWVFCEKFYVFVALVYRFPFAQNNHLIFLVYELWCMNVIETSQFFFVKLAQNLCTIYVIVGWVFGCNLYFCWRKTLLLFFFLVLNNYVPGSDHDLFCACLV